MPTACRNPVPGTIRTRTPCGTTRSCTTRTFATTCTTAPSGAGDDWLALQIPRILASPAFTERNSLLVLTWDEGSGANNNVATIFAGPAAKRGYRTDIPYGHYSLLRTIEDAWDLDPLTDNDTHAAPMNDLLR